MSMNLAAITEHIASIIPDRECIVFRDRRFNWAEINDRTRRLAQVLKQAGLGQSIKPRSELENWQSGQDHVGLYLYNGNEYLEGMLASYKARTVPFNVNYRYVEEELLYLFNNAQTKALIYHACLAPTIEKIRQKLDFDPLLIQVADESEQPLLAGALDYETAIQSAEPLIPQDLSGEDLYMLYTGGTTGMPKGVLWQQQDLYQAAIGLGSGFTRPEQITELINHPLDPNATPLRGLLAPPFMHATAHWIALMVWFQGGTVIIQSEPKHLDADDIWRSCEQEQVRLLAIVGDAFAIPLIEALDANTYDLSKLQMISSGGAMLSAPNKQAFMQRLPHLFIMDALGSSEAGVQAHKLSAKDQTQSSGDFALAAGSVVLDESLTTLLSPGSNAKGWLAKSGAVPLGYLNDPEKTQKTFPTVDGVRYSVPGDRATLDEAGQIILLGRDSVTINSGGEKIFAEEVEHALKAHPDVQDVVVVGTPNPRFGSQVTALVQLRAGITPDTNQLNETAKKSISGYKVPKDYIFMDKILRAPSGKPDYNWAKRTAETLLAERQNHADQPV